MAPLYPLYDAELMRPPQEFDSLTGLVPGRSAQAFNPELLYTWRGYLILSGKRQPAAGSISQWKWEHGCVYIPEARRAGPHTVPFSGQGIRRLHLQQENKIQSHKVNLEPEPAAHYIITSLWQYIPDRSNCLWFTVKCSGALLELFSPLGYSDHMPVFPAKCQVAGRSRF